MSDRCPKDIHLLMKLWEADKRFVPEGVRSWPNPGGLHEWQWSGGKDQSGGDVHLDLFHNWTMLDQQTLLENAVGKIFSLGSANHKTVIQIHGKDVSIKHRDLKIVRRFSSQKTMLGNLFNAIIKMVEVVWLPMHKGKDNKYYYTEVDRLQADNEYEIEMMSATKKTFEEYNKPVQTSVLPPDDPFSGSLMDKRS